MKEDVRAGSPQILGLLPAERCLYGGDDRTESSLPRASRSEKVHTAQGNGPIRGARRAENVGPCVRATINVNA